MKCRAQWSLVVASAASHVDTDPDVLSVAAFHFLILKATLEKNIDSPPVEHSEEQGVTPEPQEQLMHCKPASI